MLLFSYFLDLNFRFSLKKVKSHFIQLGKYGTWFLVAQETISRLDSVSLWAGPTPRQTGRGCDTVEPLHYSKKMVEVRELLATH